MAASGSEIVVGVSGASGGTLATGFLRVAAGLPQFSRIHLIVSGSAMKVASAELSRPVASGAEYVSLLDLPAQERGKIVVHENGDVAAPVASGSYPTSGMVVIPCSGGTLACVAHGVSRGLLQRAADVTLKERRPLVLAFRETPYSLVHIENMRAAAMAGAIVMPPSPPFYVGTASVERLLDAYYRRILRIFGAPMPEEYVWTGPPRAAR